MDTDTGFCASSGHADNLCPLEIAFPADHTRLCNDYKKNNSSTAITSKLITLTDHTCLRNDYKNSNPEHVSTQLIQRKPRHSDSSHCLVSLVSAWVAGATANQQPSLHVRTGTHLNTTTASLWRTRQQTNPPNDHPEFSEIQMASI